MTNKEFWKTIKPFLTNKGCLENSDIMLINDDEMVTFKNLRELHQKPHSKFYEQLHFSVFQHIEKDTILNMC